MNPKDSLGTYILNLYMYILIYWASLVAQRLKHLPGMRETWVRSLGQEDPLEKENGKHSSTLAWRIPWREATTKQFIKVVGQYTLQIAMYEDLSYYEFLQAQGIVNSFICHMVIMKWYLTFVF